ncbi:glycosyltransferase family 2 protein [Pedobacter duraquae]|uniref:Glycosyltransferase involved in cell wall biosynthesis n=1 Tax=Pedobacter duraquae TaxID=425511 RepID=A0A4R6ILV3_9SPHI|nr:glycosyltransferase family 2 protein [Pedobacter duraquae]TDO23139.1 glycosyltransferase involved in cell wall biosynthesis [Pedobacter duraquae]
MAADFPLVSIIVPCYNQGIFLGYTLDSILQQSYTNWECVIINDGSTDETSFIADSYLKKDTRFIYMETVNQGLSASRNTAIKNSSGVYIQLLDADDLLEKDKLKNAVAYYCSDAATGQVIMYSSMRYFEDGSPESPRIIGRDNFVGHIEIKKSDTIERQHELLISRNPFVISAPLYPRELFDGIGYFDESLSALEDWDFHLRCNYAGYRFHHIYHLYSYTLIRLHNNSMMRNQKLLDDNFYTLIAKHKLRKIEPIKKQHFVKKLTILLCPPILVKSYHKLKAVVNKNV